MNKSLKVLLFPVIFLLINHGIGQLYLNKRLADSRTGLIDSQFHGVEGKVEVLAMGDSHMATGFDPRVFKNAFNFALYGENYIFNYYKLKYILHRDARIKVIVLPIDLHSFSCWRAVRFLHDFYWVKYVDYLELGWHKKELLKFIGKYIQGRFFPYLGEFALVFDLPAQDERTRKVPQPRIFQGFIIKTETFDQNREKRARQRVRLHFQQQRCFDEVAAVYFEKILQLCARYHKPLVLVKFPVSALYYRYASQKVAVEELYEKIRLMIQPYSNVTVLDYQKSFFEHDAVYFDDPDHLNERGARVLSERIRNELLTLNILH